MNAVRRFLDFFWDSPTYGRDRASLITGFTIGTAALLLNGAVLMLALPFLLAPDEPPFQRLTDHLGFGQLFALILLGGTTIFASLLVPLRLVTVFFEPRVGRYFDQIVLSGISPLRFLIGKATSQNLFLGLALFLLIPYFVLSLSLGGVDLTFCAAAVFLIWLYCMALALTTLWLSLYANEFLAAIVVIGTAITLCILGCFPMSFQPFVFTPFPALLHPIHLSIPGVSGIVSREFWPVFWACAMGMAGLCCAALFAIYLGPLYGIIRENSTFGEVVRAGDTKRKRWFRFRQHIQRSSEIAFFYKNRSERFLRSEGLIRWGIGLVGAILLSAGFDLLLAAGFSKTVGTWGPSPHYWVLYNFHAAVLAIHGVGLACAVLLFSHAKNTTFLRIPFFRGIRVEVSRLDTWAFLLFLAFSTAASLETPLVFEQVAAAPRNTTVFPANFTSYFGDARVIDLRRVNREGTLVISLIGLVLYVLQRLTCLGTWMKTTSFIAVSGLYTVIIVLVPMLTGVMALELVDELARNKFVSEWAPVVFVVSPFPMLYVLFHGRLGHPFPDHVSLTSFYVVHAVILAWGLFQMRRTGRKLRGQYLTQAEPETPRE